MFDLTTVAGWMRAIHVVFGFGGLALFWAPVVLPKGSRSHRAWGLAFVGCSGLVLATALASSAWSIADPEGRATAEFSPAFIRFFGILLGDLGLYTLVPLTLAIWAVRVRRTPDGSAGLGPRIVVALEAGAASATAGYAALGDLPWQWRAVLGGLAVAGLYGARDHARFLRRPWPTPMHWWYKHMEYMLGAGIAFHTAFLVFGSLRLWNLGLSGPWAIVPWVAPTLVGVPLVRLWVRSYRLRFEPPARVAA